MKMPTRAFLFAVTLFLANTSRADFETVVEIGREGDYHGIFI
jgi:hypothetical protein